MCMGYAVRITSRAVEAVQGVDKTQGIVAAEASGVGVGIRKRLGSTDLRLRPGSNPGGKVVRQGAGWVVEGGSPYASYAGTPMSGTFPSPGSAGFSATPFSASVTSPNPSASPAHRRNASGLGLGISSPAFGPPPSATARTPVNSAYPFPTAATTGSPYSGNMSAPPTPGTAGNGFYSHFPPTPNPVNGGTGFPRSPVPGTPGLSAQQGITPPPRRESSLRHSSNESVSKIKDD